MVLVPPFRIVAGENDFVTPMDRACTVSCGSGRQEIGHRPGHCAGGNRICIGSCAGDTRHPGCDHAGARRSNRPGRDPDIGDREGCRGNGGSTGGRIASCGKCWRESCDVGKTSGKRIHQTHPVVDSPGRVAKGDRENAVICLLDCGSSKRFGNPDGLDIHPCRGWRCVGDALAGADRTHACRSGWNGIGVHALGVGNHIDRDTACGTGSYRSIIECHGSLTWCERNPSGAGQGASSHNW